MSSQQLKYVVGRNLIREKIQAIAEGVGSLDTLAISQLITVWRYFEDISKTITDHQVGQPIKVEEWFFALSPSQQSQVIAYGRSKNVGEQITIVPNWYSNIGQRGGFRLEIPTHLPVASR